MGRKAIIKYDSALRVKVIALAGQYTDEQIADKLGVSKWTIARWKRNDKLLAKHMKDTRKQATKNSLKLGIRKLAEGAEVYEETTKYVDVVTDPDTGQERHVTKTIKRKVLPPDVGALKMLAAKYANGEYVEKEEKEINISISRRDKAMTLEDRKALLLEDANEGTKEVIEAEFRELERELSS